MLLALIVPVTQVGQVLGQLFIGPQVATFRRTKVALSLTEVGSGLAIAFAAGVAVLVGPTLGGLVIIAGAGLFGCCWGLYTICHQDIISRVLTPRQRGAMMAGRAAAGGVLTMVFTMVLYRFFPDALDNKTLLLWAAVALWLAAGGLYAGIAEAPKPPRQRASPVRELSRGIALARAERWFGEFLLGRLWLLSVELAIPFYAIHVALLDDPTASDLVVIVFALSAGLLLGGPVWSRAVPRNCRVAMAAGALLVAFAGVLTLLVDEVLQARIPYFHVATFALLSFGQQGVIQARIFYLGERTPADDRPIYVSISESSMGACGVGVALALGFAAQFTSVFNPLLCLIALNAVAAVFVLQVLQPPR